MICHDQVDMEGVQAYSILSGCQIAYPALPACPASYNAREKRLFSTVANGYLPGTLSGN
jgi:hypothetical protein